MFHPEKTYIKLAKSTLQFMWLPKRCVLTKKILWLNMAYRLDFIWSLNYSRLHQLNPVGDGPYPVTHYGDRNAVTIAILKGDRF